VNTVSSDRGTRALLRRHRRVTARAGNIEVRISPSTLGDRCHPCAVDSRPHAA
jgi:hypothetical protein